VPEELALQQALGDGRAVHRHEGPSGARATAGAYARLTVSDRGSGISPEDLAHLFEPFFTRKVEGTGLGLAVVAGIVRDHGGWVSVRSSPEAGTHFEVYLPALS
jgi:signal transduction histidine kinase